MLLPVFLFCSCEKEPVFHKVRYEVFADSLYYKKISLAETVGDVLRQYGITDDELGEYKQTVDMLRAMNINYDAYAISYRTLTPDNRPVLASGMIYYPRRGNPAGVIEISPVNKSKGTCGTNEYHMAEVIPGMVENYICLVPDLVGCGVSDDLPISYMQHKNTAVVSADLRRAAAEFIHNRYHSDLRSKTVLFGYSLGGACVMSLARLYQQNPSYGVEVTHIFAGGGAYEPLEVVKAQVAADRSDYAIIPNILLSLDHYDHLNLDYSDYFKGPLLDHYQEWCDGNLPISDLTRRLGTRPSTYLSDELLSWFAGLSESSLGSSRGGSSRGVSSTSMGPSGAPSASSGAPSVSSGAPSTSSGAPSVSSGAPSASSGAPSVSSGVPSASSGDPSASSGDPSASSGVPSAAEVSYQKLYEVLLDKNLPLDWVPRAKVHLFHAKEDFHVPVVCGDRLNDYLVRSGADVIYEKYDAGHVMSGLLIELDFYEFLKSHRFGL